MQKSGNFYKINLELYFNFIRTLKNILFNYLGEREGQHGWREGEGERLPTEQRTLCGVWSQDPQIMAWSKGKPPNQLSHSATPLLEFLIEFDKLILNIKGQIKEEEEKDNFKSEVGMSSNRNKFYNELNYMLT